MDRATNKITEEISSLIDVASDLQTRYETESNRLSEEFRADNQYFCTRIKYISANTPNANPNFHGVATQFEFTHCSERKSSICDFDEDIVGVKVHLRTTKKELENGLLWDVQELIDSDHFDSHLEQADKLLSKNYKDAAAVIIGGVLEDRLRYLSKVRNLPLKDGKDKWLMMGNLNTNLYQDEAYKLNINQLILGYTNIRNNAAHGKFEEYNKTQVEQMSDFVKKFISE